MTKNGWKNEKWKNGGHSEQHILCFNTAPTYPKASQPWGLAPETIHHHTWRGFLKKGNCFLAPISLSEMWQRAPSFKKTEDVHFFLGVKTFYMFYTQVTIWIGKKMQLKLTLCKKPHLFHSSALPNWLCVWVCNPLTKAFPLFIHSSISSQAMTINQNLTNGEATRVNKTEFLLSGSGHFSGWRQTTKKWKTYNAMSRW